MIDGIIIKAMWLFLGGAVYEVCDPKPDKDDRTRR